MRTLALSTVFVILAGAAASQQPGDWSVQRLLFACEAAATPRSINSADDQYEAALCMGSVRGVGVMLAYNCSSKEEGYLPLYQADVPPSLGAAIQAYVNWARENPDMWGEQSQDGIILALMETFPCNE